MEIFKEQIEKIDPVDGIIADLETSLGDLPEDHDGLIEVDALVTFLESVNWLDASKGAIMEVIDRHTEEERKINYRVALHAIVQD